MKKELIFIHCAGRQGHHEGSQNLLTYLKHALSFQYNILAPNMPDPVNPRYELWKKMLVKEFADLEGEVVLVGHSLGGSVLLKFLSEEKCFKAIGGLFLVSTPFWGVKDWKIEEFVIPKNFSTHISKIPKIFLYHSIQDEWVPFKHLEYYAKKLPDAKVRVVEGNEHEFFYGLPELVEDIKNL